MKVTHDEVNQCVYVGVRASEPLCVFHETLDVTELLNLKGASVHIDVTVDGTILGIEVL